MKAYTVKIPSQWEWVDSDRARVYLREFFIHPLMLPPDPGAGEHAARLTLNEKQVDALARGSGDKPAVALRRLLAARVGELPATIPTAIIRAQAKMEPRRTPVVGESLSIPAWFDSLALSSPWSLLASGSILPLAACSPAPRTGWPVPVSDRDEGSRAAGLAKAYHMIRYIDHTDAVF